MRFPAKKPDLLTNPGKYGWLEGRDSNPDTVVQRAGNGLQSLPARSVLCKLSALSLQCAPLRSAFFTHKMSLVSQLGIIRIAARPSDRPASPAAPEYSSPAAPLLRARAALPRT